MPIGHLADEDKNALNDARLATANFSGAKMHLFQTLTSIDHTITESTLAANECSFAGYSAQTLSGWSASALTADFHSQSSASPVTFGPNTSGSDSPVIRGWWYKDAVTGLCIVAGLFDNPFIILNGQTYVVTPTFRLTGE